MNPVTLFVRSYNADFEWLSYSVQSMRKYLHVDHKILMVPKDTSVPDDIKSYFDEILYSFMYSRYPGYIAQQFDKLDAWRYVDTPYILYSDSDCIYYDHLDAQTMFDGPRPILGVTPYSEMTGDVLQWKPITEGFLGFKVDFEFMRCLPLMHRTETLRELANDLPDLPSKVVGNGISEFNLIGAYAFRNNHPYKFVLDVPRYPCHQFWSYSGLTSEERTKIEKYINGN